MKIARAEAAPSEIPAVLVALLRAALHAEQAARGPQKREQHRVCRAHLGGAQEAGFSLRDVAPQVGRSYYTLRDRAKGCESVSVVEFAALADIAPEALSRWLLSCTHEDEGAKRDEITARFLIHSFIYHSENTLVC